MIPNYESGRGERGSRPALAILNARRRRGLGAKPAMMRPQPPKEIIRPPMMAKPISIADSDAAHNTTLGLQQSLQQQKPRGSTMPGVVNDTGYSQQLPPDVAQTHPQQGVVRDYVLNGARYVSNGARPQFRRSPEEREDISGIENPILAARRRRIPV